jgi:hypothetical protein
MTTVLCDGRVCSLIHGPLNRCYKPTRLLGVTSQKTDTLIFIMRTSDLKTAQAGVALLHNLNLSQDTNNPD